MASSALEAKINKIRQQNEEIERRYKEVEEDKKNAAKLNALVQMVPSTDWPERKEPPEFSNPPRAKQKVTKEKHEHVPQSHPMEGKKIHAFAQGEGPPPDPKYNFLADSEREEYNSEHPRENFGNRTHNKVIRGNFRKKNIGRDGMQKDVRIHKGNYRDEYQPGYDAWRAERNRIDEDRISRQRTAEGNWRREWDNDKIHIIDDAMKSSTRPMLGDFAKKDYKDFDRRYHVNGSEHVNHGRGANHRTYRGQSKNFHSNYENRPHNSHDQHRHNMQMPVTAPLSPNSEERTVVATDKSIKVTLNQGNMAKGPVMSVKVNSPNIAGTGRVGPRQRSRVTYCQSGAEVTTPEIEPFPRQKSFDDKSRTGYFNNQKSPNIKRSQSQRKADTNSKSPYLQRREIKREEDDSISQIQYENEFKSYSQKSQSTSKSPKQVTVNTKTTNSEGENSILQNKIEDKEAGDKSDTKSEENVDTLHIENDVTSEVNMKDVQDNILENIETSLETSNQISLETQKTDDTVLIAQEETKDLEETPPENGTIESVPTSAVSPENSECVTKDTDRKNDSIDKEDCSKDVNTSTNPEENSSSFFDRSVPNEIESQEECTENKDNEISDIIKLDDSLKKDNEENISSHEISEPLLSDNCDKVKEEADDEQLDVNQKESSAENVVCSSEAETCTVIELTDKGVCDDETIIKETVNESKPTDENNESNTCCKKDINDAAKEIEVTDTNIVNSTSEKVNGSLEDKTQSQEESLVEKKMDKEESEKVDDSNE